LDSLLLLFFFSCGIAVCHCDCSEAVTVHLPVRIVVIVYSLLDYCLCDTIVIIHWYSDTFITHYKKNLFVYSHYILFTFL